MPKIALTALVAIHLALTGWHGRAHTQLAILLPPAKNAFVYIVILVAPTAAASLLWTRYFLAGAWTLFPLNGRCPSLRRLSPLRADIA